MNSSLLRGLAFTSLSLVAFAYGCAPPQPDEVVPQGLSIAEADTTVQGTFGYEGMVVHFRARTLEDGAKAVLELDIDGKALAIEIDFEAQTLVEDADGNTFEESDRAVLLALRDAVLEKVPEVIETPHGKLLVKVADRYAEVPVGRSLSRREVAFALDVFPRYATTGGCGGDGVTCLSGTSGSSWAVFKSGSTCQAEPTAYGDSVCRGRCGIGCNWFDNDYTWDCLDHDVCLDYQSDCSAEFADAADDWAATMAPLCWSGSSRSKPAELPAICGDGKKGGSEACDDGNGANGDGCDTNCTPSTCGNGIVGGSEQCDDGGTAPDDGCSATCTLELAGLTHIVINEIDYDQPSSDVGEFIELYNAAPNAVSLDGLALILVNGATMLEYERVALSGSLAAGGYAIVCPPGGSAATCAASVTPAAGTTIFTFDAATNNIQNGAPDGVILIDVAAGTAIDAVSYEGAITAATVTGLGSFTLVEGSQLTVLDDGLTAGQSIARFANGSDTDDASADWALRPSSPGAPNL